MNADEKLKLIEERVDGLIDRAKIVLQKATADGQDFLHVAFPIKLIGDVVAAAPVGLRWEDVQSKMRMLDGLFNACRKTKCDALLVITDARTKNVANLSEEQVDELLANCRHGEIAADTTNPEVLICVLSGQGMLPKVRIINYHRVGTKIVFDKEETIMQGLDGDFDMTLCPPEWLHKNWEKA